MIDPSQHTVLALPLFSEILLNNSSHVIGTIPLKCRYKMVTPYSRAIREHIVIGEKGKEELFKKVKLIKGWPIRENACQRGAVRTSQTI